MKPDGLLNEQQHFFTALPDGNAARKVRNISTEAFRAFFYNDHVTHETS